MKTSDLPNPHHIGITTFITTFRFAFHDGRPTATAYFITDIDIMVGQISKTLQQIQTKLWYNP